MRNLGLTLAVLVLAASAFGTCDSISAKYSGNWRPMASAPHDGTAIETLETFGVAPWYGRFRWIKKGSIVHTIVYAESADGKKKAFRLNYPEPNGRWASTSDERSGVDDNDECLFWRPTAQGGKYVDPTGGAQDSVEYWCTAMHRGYDKAKDRCK